MPRIGLNLFTLNNIFSADLHIVSIEMPDCSYNLKESKHTDSQKSLLLILLSKLDTTFSGIKDQKYVSNSSKFIVVSFGAKVYNIENIKKSVNKLGWQVYYSYHCALYNVGMETGEKQLIKSLGIVGEYFKDIESACIEGHYKIEAERLIEASETLRCIKIYAILKDIKKLTGRKLEVLVYYLLYGYSKDTKKDVIRNIRITDSNLNNINHELRKMGVINSVGYNQATNEVNQELLEFKKFIVDDKGSYVLIKLS